ncbi:hypothetical protein A2U01_0097854, partial [Trifolium medium]|nr:hypothetical protein [Trifolium medium]
MQSGGDSPGSINPRSSEEATVVAVIFGRQAT